MAKSFEWLRGYLKPSIDRGVKKGVKQAVDNLITSGALDKAILDVLAKPKFKWFWFVKHMQKRMMEIDKTLTGKRAYGIALNTYRDFLNEEKIEFGDPAYDWSEDAARDLIQAYEIDHWESAS